MGTIIQFIAVVFIFFVVLTVIIALFDMRPAESHYAKAQRIKASKKYKQYLRDNPND